MIDKVKNLKKQGFLSRLALAVAIAELVKDEMDEKTEKIEKTMELMKKLPPEQERVIAETIIKMSEIIQEIVRDKKKMDLLRKLQSWKGRI